MEQGTLILILILRFEDNNNFHLTIKVKESYLTHNIGIYVFIGRNSICKLLMIRNEK